MSTMIEDNITERKEDIKYLTILVKRLETDTDKERNLVEDLQTLPVESIHGLLSQARKMTSGSFDDDYNHELHSSLAVLLKRLTVKLQPLKPQVCSHSFTKFTKLPQEIKDLIWTETFVNDRIIEFSWFLVSVSRWGSVLLATDCKLVSAQALVPLVSKRSNQIFQEFHENFSFELRVDSPGVEFRAWNASVNFGLDIPYFNLFTESASMEIHSNGRDSLDPFDQFQRVACSRESFYSLLNEYIQSPGTSIRLILALKSFKALKELVLVRVLEFKSCIDVPPQTPLVFLPEDTNENEAGIEYLTPKNAKKDAKSDPYAFLIDIEKQNDPEAIIKLWNRALEIGGIIKTFKDVKLTFRLAKRDYSPPLSKMLECYCWTL